MFTRFRFFTNTLIVTFILVFFTLSVGFAQNEFSQPNTLQLPSLDENPQNPEQGFPSLPLNEQNIHNEDQNQTTTGPGNPFLPSQQPDTSIQPHEDQPVIQWKQMDLSETFGYDPIITGVVKYPANWAVNVDTWNKRVVFSEDQNGFVSFTAFLPVQGNLQNAQAYAQQIAGWLQSVIPDLRITNQDYRTDPSSSQTGMNLTRGNLSLQGTYQGQVFLFRLETNVLYVPVANISYLSALLCQAPQPVFQEKMQTYFNPMLVTFGNLWK